MRLVSLRSGTDTHAGLLLGERVLDLTVASTERTDWADLPRSVRGIISGGDAVSSRIDAIANEIETDCGTRRPAAPCRSIGAHRSGQAGRADS